MNWICSETGRQEYAGNNCMFSAGLVDGHPVDELYLEFGKDGEEAQTLLLRPDEAAIICWLLSGALWSYHMRVISTYPAGA